MSIKRKYFAIYLVRKHLYAKERFSWFIQFQLAGLYFISYHILMAFHDLNLLMILNMYQYWGTLTETVLNVLILFLFLLSKNV